MTAKIKLRNFTGTKQVELTGKDLEEYTKQLEKDQEHYAKQAREAAIVVIKAFILLVLICVILSILYLLIYYLFPGLLLKGQ